MYLSLCSADVFNYGVIENAVFWGRSHLMECLLCEKQDHYCNKLTVKNR